MSCVHVLYDPYRPVVNSTIKKEIERQMLSAVWWTGIVAGGLPCVSINAGHKQIVRYAKHRELQQVTILEEDVMFTHPDSWAYYLDNMPKSFDVYLGGTYGLVPGIHRPVITTHITGLHCYTIHSRFYDRFLSVSDNAHIDVALDGLGEYIVCYPMIALQHPGWSSNNKGKVNYNKTIPESFLYK